MKTFTLLCNQNPIQIIESFQKNQHYELRLRNPLFEIGSMKFTTGKQCHIDILKLFPAYRNQNIGSCFYSFIEQHYFSKCESIYLEADSDDSMRFWKKQGFRVDYFEEEMKHYLMEKIK